MSKVFWEMSDAQHAVHLFAVFPSLESVFSYQAEVISEGKQSEVVTLELAGVTYYIKRYFRISGLRSWLGFSRLRMEARNQKRFTQWGLNAAPVVAYGEEYQLYRTLRGALITAGIEHSVNLEHIAQKQPYRLADKQWRDGVINQVVAMVRLLHQHRFCHNDLFLRNLLIQTDTDNKPTLFLIDCPSGSFWFGRMLYRRKVKDIASLDKHASDCLTRTQRLRFMLKYFAVERLGNKEKAFIREVLDYPARRQKRKQRRRKI